MRRNVLLPAALLLLTACADTLADIQSDTEKFLHTTSGATADWQQTLTDTVELGRLEAEKLKKGIEDAGKTVDQVKEGVAEVQEGIDAINEAKANINF